MPEGAAEAYLREVFTTLLENKALPKYQFERRIDIFLNVFLAEIVSKLLGGSMEIDSVAGHGTRVTATSPPEPIS